jgi:hypothetical protein
VVATSSPAANASPESIRNTRVATASASEVTHRALREAIVVIAMLTVSL